MVFPGLVKTLAGGSVGVRPAHGSGGVRLKFAKMATSAEAVKAQVRPLQARPPKPSKKEAGSAVGVKETGVPDGTAIEQVPGQSMPAGVDTRRPPPVPTRFMVSSTMTGG